MTGPVSARESALRVLIEMRTHSAWADAALKAQIARDGLSSQDAALATRLVYGTVQNKMLLDHYIAAFCSQKPDHLQFPLLDILRLGVYQIVFLDKIPDSAAVNESVNLTRTFGRAQAAGLVNAVLRNVSRNRDRLPEVPRGDETAYLSVTYSHPKWLVKRLLALLGREETEAFLREDNGVTPLTVQINPLRTTAEELTEELTAAGVRVRAHSWVPGCLELSGAGDLTALPPFRQGKFQVQDAAARLVADAARPAEGSRIIDMCAAPGGKSFNLAAAMGDRGEILSCDLHAGKLRQVEQGAARLGFTCIRTEEADGRIFRPEWSESADLVLVDAPCSGLGIIRKKPDIRYKNPNSLFSMPVVQTEILDNAARYVRHGGALIYSTCTLLPEENGEITDAFLAGHPEFAREAFLLPPPVGTVEEGQITLWPQRNGVDGFYICRMRRA